MESLVDKSAFAEITFPLCSKLTYSSLGNEFTHKQSEIFIIYIKTSYKNVVKPLFMRSSQKLVLRIVFSLIFQSEIRILLDRQDIQNLP